MMSSSLYLDYRQNTRFKIPFTHQLYTGVTVQLKVALLQQPSWGKMCAKEGASSCSASVSPHGWHTASEKLSACWHTHIHTLTLTLYPQQVSPTEGWRRQTSVSFLSFFQLLYGGRKRFGPQRVQYTGAWSHVSGPARPFLWASHWDWIEPGRGCQGGLRQEAGGEEVASGRPGGRPMGKTQWPFWWGRVWEKWLKAGKNVLRPELMGECQANVGHMVVIQLPGCKKRVHAVPQRAPKLPLHRPSIRLLSHWHWLSIADGSLEWTLATGNQE